MRFRVFARSCCFQISPGLNRSWPFFKKTDAVDGNLFLFDRIRSKNPSLLHETGLPCSASKIAGDKRSCHFNFPNFLCAINSPATVPGTPTDNKPSRFELFFIFLFSSRYISTFAAEGAFSLKLNEVVKPS